mmetsp:Transcript_10268/g.21153  ORF Transcript_10268/g.21153 Transcript_10268/m.21153 type:complete len:149 (-) Transcript_10268:183-629(-)
MYAQVASFSKRQYAASAENYAKRGNCKLSLISLKRRGEPREWIKHGESPGSERRWANNDQRLVPTQTIVFMAATSIKRYQSIDLFFFFFAGHQSLFQNKCKCGAVASYLVVFMFATTALSKMVGTNNDILFHNIVWQLDGVSFHHFSL